MLKKHIYTLLSACFIAGGMCACHEPETTVNDAVSEYISVELEERLLIAAAEGDVETMDKMLRSGAYVNIMDRQGNTPLALVARAGHKECVQLLLKTPGIVLTTYNYHQQTPLSSADRSVSPLLENELNNLISQENPTSLQKLSMGGLPSLRQAMEEATASDDAHLMRFMLMLGADPDMDLGYPATPLHYAIINNSHQCLKLLLQYGAHIHVASKDGKTPLQLADFHKATECREILEKVMESRSSIPTIYPAFHRSHLSMYFKESTDNERQEQEPLPAPTLSESDIPTSASQNIPVILHDIDTAFEKYDDIMSISADIGDGSGSGDDEAPIPHDNGGTPDTQNNKKQSH